MMMMINSKEEEDPGLFLRTFIWVIKNHKLFIRYYLKFNNSQ